MYFSDDMRTEKTTGSNCVLNPYSPAYMSPQNKFYYNVACSSHLLLTFPFDWQTLLKVANSPKIVCSPSCAFISKIGFNSTVKKIQKVS